MLGGRTFGRWPGQHAGVVLTNGISDFMKEAPQSSVTPPPCGRNLESVTCERALT